ncbi:Dyp-type peroxidase [Spongiactinospora sp. TRM90649]|uniref:Dyp-type peroxidase n=1 Tax=Spongiactinospora sp. TRM90649 TaxID=3031114 RepID=UPI0023F9DABF|nr:Dyp-type peroxidase [Spongiactinospora sp. TRM90649]MDF5756250.1 Dyp-type peroxidase [Spongiactinospora sp. TRM90649]
MPVDLNNARPLDWDSATLDADTKGMLNNLQANILRAHVREHLSVLFVRFNDVKEGRRFLRELAETKVKTARRHLEEVRDFARNARPGTPYVGIGISKAGYRDLGHSVEEVRKFADPVFRDGMKRRVAVVDDPPVDQWEKPYQREIHAVIVIGDARPGPVAALREEILGDLPESARLLGEETGRGLHNDAGDGIEHFGYVDGRSQPLFVKDEVDREPKEHWNPAFPLSNILVADPFAPNRNRHFGSYFVFRKLEQDVRAFHEIERNLADELGLVGADRDRAGAMLIGRFRDGTPLTSKPKASGGPVSNDFNFDADTGSKCPFSGHVRKTNPRSFGREVLMARRGQTYGERTDDPTDDSPPENRPSSGVGLLFMAFNARLIDQFEFTQQSWANNPDFQNPGTGHDAVIGQGTRSLKVTFPKVWGKPEMSPAQPQVAQTVTMKGGEYFFMPSLAYLNNL